MREILGHIMNSGFLGILEHRNSDYRGHRTSFLSCGYLVDFFLDGGVLIMWSVGTL